MVLSTSYTGSLLMIGALLLCAVQCVVLYLLSAEARERRLEVQPNPSSERRGQHLIVSMTATLMLQILLLFAAGFTIFS